MFDKKSQQIFLIYYLLFLFIIIHFFGEIFGKKENAPKHIPLNFMIYHYFVTYRIVTLFSQKNIVISIRFAMFQLEL